MSLHQYQNLGRMMAISDAAWRVASRDGLVDLAVRHVDAPFMRTDDHTFINLCSCSYLGWDRHPAILEGAIQGIRAAGTLHLTTARCRLFLSLLEEYEFQLGSHFRATAVAYNSCAAASSACLPILASGAMTDGHSPVMAFDKFAHFSLAQMKALCGDETEVVTLENNDMDALEALCQQHPCVAYVSDATYSIQGFADIPRLKELQDRYGLFIYLDDSHGLSITGERGEGLALQQLSPLNSRAVVVASLAKAFGAAGGMLLSGHPDIKRLVVRYGNAWSQYLNSASIGGGMAALGLHASTTLAEAQAMRAKNCALLDAQFPTLNAGELSPIRVVPLRDPEAAIQAARQLMERGFYTSAVFFPVVPKGTAGLRIMPRADIPESAMHDFCTHLREVCENAIVERQA